MTEKSTVEEIRARFDSDVERFSNLETGQSAILDAPLVLDLITRSAMAIHPGAREVLDVGCGAGNYTLKLLQKIPGLNVTLVDLSLPMLERARQRISQANGGLVTIHQADIRELELPPAKFDIIMAAAVFHHLRSDDEWRQVFAKCHTSLKSGGSLWISDMVEHPDPEIQAILKQNYGNYLAQFKDSAYRDHVFSYIEKEDTPRSMIFQLDLLREVGFRSVEILHKNGIFAAFCAFK